ncbi:hypothetical protein [Bradyrhizobium sp. HKCCYLR20261]|uniref:hypothetical protein n=1 Tax=unclassified Bradyrhizobium TaxID=2631580 RepID=UPI003EB946DC
MARLQKRKQAAVTTGLAEHTRPSLRDGFTTYTWSPWCAGLVGHHGDNALARLALDTSIGVSGPHDFAVRNEPFVGAAEATLRSATPIAFRCRRP